jgi:tetratricopeptide (TPR) repeat protein
MKPDGRYAIDLLIDEAWDCHEEGRYADGLAAAERAVEGARQLGDLTLQVRAADVEGVCLDMLGDDAAALVRYTWILGLAQDARLRADLQSSNIITRIFAHVHVDWVYAARYLPEIPASKLFEVLDAGEAWLRAMGHLDWRAALLAERAEVCSLLDRHEEAIAYLQEAIALDRRHPDAPGSSRASYLSSLGDILLDVHRVIEAQAAYEQAREQATSVFDRKLALQGLALVALAHGDVTRARRQAEEAVQLSESMGAEELGDALAVLLEVERGANDSAAASGTIDRLLPLRRRVRRDGLYRALRTAADISLDRGDLTNARQYLEEATPVAGSLDRQRGGTRFENELNERRQRLDALESSSSVDAPAPPAERRLT